MNWEPSKVTGTAFSKGTKQSSTIDFVDRNESNKI